MYFTDHVSIKLYQNENLLFKKLSDYIKFYREFDYLDLVSSDISVTI